MAKRANPKMQLGRCEGCDRPIFWALCEKADGGDPVRVPLDPRAVVYRVVIDSSGEQAGVAEIASRGQPMAGGRVFRSMVSHFATCPAATKFSSSARRRRGGALADCLGALAIFVVAFGACLAFFTPAAQGRDSRRVPVPPAGEVAPAPSAWIDDYLVGEGLDEAHRPHLAAAYVAGWYAGLGELDVDPHAAHHLRLESAFEWPERWRDEISSAVAVPASGVERLEIALSAYVTTAEAWRRTVEQRLERLERAVAPGVVP